MPEADPKVPIPCPKCSNHEVMLLYRHPVNAALMCPQCEHIWAVLVADDELLRRIPPTQVPHH